MLQRPHSGIPFGVTLVQVRPPFCETLTKPSSEPHQSTPRRLGDSAKVKMVA